MGDVVFGVEEARGEKQAVPCRHSTLLFHQHMHSPKPWSMGVCALNHKRGPGSFPPALSYIAYCRNGGHGELV